MKLQGVKTARKVHYPDKFQAAADKSLLKIQPKRWKGSRLAGAVLSAALLAQLTSCASRSESQSSTDSLKQSESQSQSEVFIYGGAPPSDNSYLSEEKALAIIRQELEKNDLRSRGKNGAKSTLS